MFGLEVAFAAAQLMLDTQAHKHEERMRKLERELEREEYDCYCLVQRAMQKEALSFEERIRPRREELARERRHKELLSDIERASRRITSAIEES
jgi:hypothetical protein